MELTGKPTPGGSCRLIKLLSNYFTLEVPSGNIYHYDVTIHHKGHCVSNHEVAACYRITGKLRNREIFDALLKGHDKFKGMLAAYDGSKNMFTRVPLDIENGYLRCQVVVESKYPIDGSDYYEVHIKPVIKAEVDGCAINLNSLHALSAGQISSVPQDAIMALNIILQFGMSMHYYRIERSFLYPPPLEDCHPLGGGKEIWFGYKQSVRVGHEKPLLNLDVKARAFNKTGPLLNCIAEFLETDISQLAVIKKLTYADISRISREFRNARLQTTHLIYKRNYRLLRLSRESAHELEFSAFMDGKLVKRSVADHFAQCYQALKYPHLPCVQMNPESKDIFLPIEVCEVVRVQNSCAKLDDKQNAEMSRFTTRPPKQRFADMSNILKKSTTSCDAYLKGFEVEIKPEPLALEGKILKAPGLRYGSGVIVKPIDGSWNMRNKQYFRGVVINSWIVLSFANIRFCTKQLLEKFASSLYSIASEHGIRMRRAETVYTVSHQKSVQSVLREVLKKYETELVVVVLPAANKTIYAEIKKVSETLLGLVTQCVKEESITRKCNTSVVSNICQKINAKLGGINNSLLSAEVPPILRKPVIIVGISILHPDPFSDFRQCVAAAVGSLDAHPCRYATAVRVHEIGRETVRVIIDLKSMMLDLLKAFYTHTKGKKPEKIICYRVGTDGEGQFASIANHEVSSIREACRNLEMEYRPGITYIAIQKGHRTRFMPQDSRYGVGKMRNIPPGTTVDTKINNPLKFNFFLCSHASSQGTSIPCHYTILMDDNKFLSDELQKLTYYLCHTSVRGTKSTSCPAPVQYARLAAERARLHLISGMDESDFHSLDEEKRFSAMEASQILEKLKNNTMYFV